MRKTGSYRKRGDRRALRLIEPDWNNEKLMPDQVRRSEKKKKKVVSLWKGHVLKNQSSLRLYIPKKKKPSVGGLTQATDSSNTGIRATAVQTAAWITIASDYCSRMRRVATGQGAKLGGYGSVRLRSSRRPECNWERVNAFEQKSWSAQRASSRNKPVKNVLVT